MTRIAAVRPAFPRYRDQQDDITGAIASIAEPDTMPSASLLRILEQTMRRAGQRAGIVRTDDRTRPRRERRTCAAVMVVS